MVGLDSEAVVEVVQVVESADGELVGHAETEPVGLAAGAAVVVEFAPLAGAGGVDSEVAGSVGAEGIDFEVAGCVAVSAVDTGAVIEEWDAEDNDFAAAGYAEADSGRAEAGDEESRAGDTAVAGTADMDSPEESAAEMVDE